MGAEAPTRRRRQGVRCLPAQMLKRNTPVRGDGRYGARPPSDPRSDPPKADTGIPVEGLNHHAGRNGKRGEKKAVPRTDHRISLMVLNQYLKGVMTVKRWRPPRRSEAGIVPPKAATTKRRHRPQLCEGVVRRSRTAGGVGCAPQRPRGWRRAPPRGASPMGDRKATRAERAER